MDRRMSNYVPVLIVAVLPSKLKEWFAILKDAIKTKNLDAVIYVLSDFASFLNLLTPMMILIAFALGNREALDYVLSRMDLLGALFGCFGWASFVCYRIAEHYKDSTKNPRGEKQEK